MLTLPPLPVPKSSPADYNQNRLMEFKKEYKGWAYYGPEELKKHWADWCKFWAERHPRQVLPGTFDIRGKRIG